MAVRSAYQDEYSGYKTSIHITDKYYKIQDSNGSLEQLWKQSIALAELNMLKVK